MGWLRITTKKRLMVHSAICWVPPPTICKMHMWQSVSEPALSFLHTKHTLKICFFCMLCMWHVSGEIVNRSIRMTFKFIPIAVVVRRGSRCHTDNNFLNFFFSYCVSYVENCSRRESISNQSRLFFFRNDFSWYRGIWIYEPNPIVVL